MFALTVQSGHAKGLSWPLGPGKLTIGRAMDCHVRLKDSLVSRRHCDIVTRDGEIILFDLGGSNTTLVNGRPVTQCTLHCGDEIAVGRSVFLVTSTETPPTEDAIDGDATTVSLADDEGASLGVHTAELVEMASLSSVADLAALYDLSRRASHARSIIDVMECLTDTLRARYAPTAIWIALYNPHSRDLEFYDADHLTAGVMAAPPVEIKRKAMKAIEKRDGLLVPIVARRGDPQVRGTLLIAPMVVAGQSIGVLLLRADSGETACDEAEFRFFRSLGATVAPYFRSVDQIERLRRDNERLRALAQSGLELIGGSRVMEEVRALIMRAASTELSVLIVGETGTGKDLAAQLIHEWSARAAKPMLTVNCAAIPPHLFESEIFGYEKGAFTGAEERRLGKIELAHGGTLFLDEVGDLSLDNQAKILRAIETGRFFRVGAERESRADVRVIAASNRDLTSLIRRGNFREDLYHRLNGFEIRMPALREHPSDIPILAEHFFGLCMARAKRPLTGFTKEAMDYLCRHRWPGNVRQLRNTIERAVALATDDRITLHDVRTHAGADSASLPEETAALSLAELERRHIERVLRQCEGRVNEAAAILGIGRSTLYNKIAEYGLAP